MIHDMVQLCRGICSKYAPSGLLKIKKNNTFWFRVGFHFHFISLRTILYFVSRNSQEAYKGYRSLFLTQKPHQRESIAIDTDPNVKVFELRNEDVELPQGDDTLYWCKMFKLQDIHQKSHVVKVSIKCDVLIHFERSETATHIHPHTNEHMWVSGVLVCFGLYPFRYFYTYNSPGCANKVVW